MTSPGTIKSIHKRFYTVVAASSNAAATSTTRVRSNSASRSLYTTPNSLSFLDPPPPPPPSSRPGNPHVITTSRLPIKGDASPGSGSAEGQQHQNGPQPPFSLALTSPHPNTSSSQPHSPPGTYYPPGHPFFPYSNPFALVPFYNASAESEKERERLGAGKRQRTRLQLDVGAYGIAKRGGRGGVKLWEQRGQNSDDADDLGLAVQVGEDAYFVRDNAMGVADGVGGWARTKHNPAPLDPSPSALFARRLMSFCSAETETETASTHTHTPSHPTSFSFPNPTRPAPWPWSLPPTTTTAFPTFPTSNSLLHKHTSQYDELAMDMDMDMEPSEVDELEEFEEGLDVLMILERAYESTIKAHVVSRGDPPPATNSTPESNEQSSGPLSQTSASPSSNTRTPTLSYPSSNPPPSPPANPSTAKPTPLLEGSSTALLAVLDHSPRPRSLSHPKSRPRSRTPSQSLSTHSTSSPPPSLKNPGPSPRRPSETKPPLKSPPADHETDTRRGSGAVLKIAHLGDCMGMLVRGEDIIWRSEEMWWSFNTPVQLGPLSPSKPSTHARTFTLPIEQDDILILASDGLSDNLWDEEVLDEVVRMRRSFLPLSSHSSSSSGASSSSGSSQSLSLSGTSSPTTSEPGSDTNTHGSGKNTPSPSPPPAKSLLGRRTLAGMLSEALCSRARRVSERRPRSTAKPNSSSKFSCDPTAVASAVPALEDEVPFARRAREQGKVFRGGKVDDISVVVAVISPADVPNTQLPTCQS
ncbi:hypothetical protein PILCRDRAFT_258726 [Piloderma croceum F 1598]|uniref:Protein phosphatase n=1 Tax=Piloderma croceum (strain F 1598) TaxID=765440 RepID=A0A0C3BMM2_PILCF|nr:hypothetical protein PILCRDRAFT_258726 [Piloderma croceum F 1598]